MSTKRKSRRVPWNKGKIVGQKAPLKLREIWAIRVRLQLRSNLRDLALFNLAIDSKLRACDLAERLPHGGAKMRRHAFQTCALEESRNPLSIGLGAVYSKGSNCGVLILGLGLRRRLRSDRRVVPSRKSGVCHKPNERLAFAVDSLR